LRLTGYTYLNWAVSVDDRKFTTPYLFSIGTGSGLWLSKKQHATSLSYTEVKYSTTMIAACEPI
jgi:hypothetical protein